MTTATAQMLSNIVSGALTRDIIIRGVSVSTQIELLGTFRGHTFEHNNLSATWLLGEDAEDFLSAGELGFDVDHPSVAVMRHALPGCDTIVVRRAYTTPLVLVTAHEAEEINVVGYSGLGFDVARLAACLADSTFAPRLKKLLVDGEPDDALLRQAHGRMVIVEAWHEGCEARLALAG